MKPIALVTAFFLALLLSPGVMAKKGDHDQCGKDKHHYGSLKNMKEQLNLSEEQEKKLKEMKNNFGKEAMKKKHEAMEKAKRDLNEALKSDISDEKLREKFTALQKIQEDFANTRFEKVLHIRSILTPEQREKFKAAIGKE